MSSDWDAHLNIDKKMLWQALRLYQKTMNTPQVNDVRDTCLHYTPYPCQLHCPIQNPGDRTATAEIHDLRLLLIEAEQLLQAVYDGLDIKGELGNQVTDLQIRIEKEIGLKK